MPTPDSLAVRSEPSPFMQDLLKKIRRIDDTPAPDVDILDAVNSLRQEVQELRAELRQRSSVIETGDRVLAEYRRLSRR